MASLINIGRGLVSKAPSGLPAGAVDMGLPSGTLWAQGNIVKDANGNYAIGEPTDYGCYFSWGNIDGHYYGDGYSFNEANYVRTTGGQLTGDIPNDDALHDAAVANIGDGWHLPTDTNFEELLNSVYTIWQRTSVDGIVGYMVTSKINGKMLFLPASGYFHEYTLYDKDKIGGYWTSVYIDTSKGCNLLFVIQNTAPYVNTTGGRKAGIPIRPVHNAIQFNNITI